MRRIFESCKVKAGTEERHASYAAGGADIDHSRFVFGSGGLEKGRKKQICEIKRTWFAQNVQNRRPFIDNGKPLTESVGTPGHVIPIDGNLVDRRPQNTAVLKGRFNSIPMMREQNARIIEKDVEFWFFPGRSVNQIACALEVSRTNAPKEFLSRGLDTLQRSEVQFQPNGFFSSRLFEVLDSCLGSVFAPGGNIYFGVLG